MRLLGSKRGVFIFILVFVLIIVLIVWALVYSGTPRIASGDNRYQDPLSHQTVSKPEGKTPDDFGTPSNNPIYLGIDKLLDVGLGFDQLNELKLAFYKYSVSLPKPIQEVSIDVDNIKTQHNTERSGSPFILLFNVRFDRQKDYQARVEYKGITDLRLYLSDTTKKVIYDSKTINLSDLSE